VGERLVDARRDTWPAVREHKRPKHRRTVTRDERAETSIEKGLADRLNIGEVKTHAAGGFQRLGDLVVDLLRVDSRPQSRAIVVHPNDLHRRATHYRVPIVASPCATSSGRGLFPLPLHGRLLVGDPTLHLLKKAGLEHLLLERFERGLDLVAAVALGAARPVSSCP
jgi:hypothetical protein